MRRAVVVLGAVLLSAGCGVATPAGPVQRPSASPSDPASETSQAVTVTTPLSIPGTVVTSEPVPGGLTARPSPSPASGSVYDVCDDDQAVRAGLDGGRLDQARSRLGVVCSPATVTDARFRFVDYLGDSHPVGRLREADGTFDLEPAQVAEWMTPPPGYDLGAYVERPVSWGEVEVGDRQPAVDTSTVAVRGGTVLGAVVNGTADYQAEVEVRITDEVTGRTAVVALPFVLLAGETAPFSVALGRDAEPGDLTFRVTSSTVQDAPGERAVSVDHPGCWWPGADETVDDYDGLDTPEVDLSGPNDADAVCIATSGFVDAVETPEQPPRGFTAPRLRVAAFAEDGTVLAVADLVIRSFGDGGATAERLGPHTSGGSTTFFRPRGTVGLGFWAWGRRA
jgi:hypothetical protein